MRVEKNSTVGVSKGREYRIVKHGCLRGVKNNKLFMSKGSRE